MWGKKIQKRRAVHGGENRMATFNSFFFLDKNHKMQTTKYGKYKINFI